MGLIVEYALEWTGGERVTVRLADRIPTAAVEEYGFHEDHEPQEWTVTDGELDLEAGVEPGDERRLVLGLVADDAAVDSFDRDEPVIEVVDGDDGGSDAAEPAGADGPDVDLSVDLEEPGPPAGRQERDDRAPGHASEGQRVDADGGVVNRGPEAGDSVASKLIAELEAGAVSESELSTLRAHLDDGSESEAVRLEYVQKRLSDFDAYVDALEDLISVHGSGDDAITDLDERLEGLADEVETVRQRQDEMANRLEDLSEALDEQAETLESHWGTHEADVEELRTEIRRRDEVLSEEFSDLQRSLDEDLAALEAEIEAFESIRRTLVDGLQRPDDLRAGTTVEDADPGALDETEEIPIVEPDEAGDDDAEDDGTAAVELDPAADDSALESGPDNDDGDDASPAVGQPEVSVDLEESLETAEASNYSGSTDSGEDDDGRPETEADQGEDEQFDDEFVRPASDGPGDGTAEEAGDGATDDTSGADDEDGTGAETEEEFLVPGPDVEDTDPGGVDENVALEDGDAAVDDPAIEDATRRDAPDDGDDADDDSGGRASSIFEIGDVDSDGSDDDDMPTIDFEDP